MQDIIDFIEHKDVINSKIAQDLGLDQQKALILQYLTKNFLSGISDVSVNLILTELYGKDKYTFLFKISHIQELLDDGLLALGGLSGFEASSLELLNSTVALSSSFLNFLEFGKKQNVKSDEIQPYKDQLEYLQEQFNRVELYQDIAKNTLLDFSPQKIKQKIKALEEKIEKRLKLSQKELYIEKLFNTHELSEKEKIIFLALLKEEYTADEDSNRELNALLSLVSDDSYEKIKNRNLLQEDGKLLKNHLIDYEEIITAFGGISRSFYIDENILTQILNPNKAKKNNKLSLSSVIESQDIFELITPTTSLDDVVMHPKTRLLMDELLKQVDKKVVARLKKWGIKKNTKGIDAKILLYGPPGTGKTMTANSLAKSLKKRILSFDCSKILSKYVGESEQNVRRIFDTYKDVCQKTKLSPILLLNEADQFLSSRTEGATSGADKMHNQMQNIFLEQIEKFEGILVATTNFLESLDMAFSRRFDYKIEFKKPDFAQRLDLWKKVLPSNAKYEENFDIKILAKYPLSGGQIILVLKNTALKVAIKDEPIFTIKDFVQTIQSETSSAFGEKNPMGFKS